VLKFARRHGHTPFAERAVAAYSRTGEHAACWLVLGLGGAALSQNEDRRQHWLHGVRVVVGAYGLNYLIKVAVRRPRPELPGLPPLTATVSGLSFPSAHATTSFAACRAFRGLAPAAALYSAAGLLAVSRPYLGVHYPSDVAAGAILGTVIGEAFTR
jgi:membrane-associated phospholipid phosphatase